MTHVLGKCQLCLTPDVIIKDSHIIPKWAYKRLRLADSAGNPNPITVTNGQAFQISNQIIEKMLCENCEQLIGNSEKYVEKIAFETDGELKFLNGLEILTVVKEGKSLEYVSLSNLNTDKIVYFASSVVWRACVAHRQDTGKPRLGQRYQEELRSYLLGGSGSFPKNARLIMGILVHSPNTPHPRHNIISFPATVRYEDYHRHGFFICGLYFELCIGSQMAGYLDSICLHYGKEKIALLGDAYDFGLIHDIEKHARSARARGKLKNRAIKGAQEKT